MRDVQVKRAIEQGRPQRRCPSCGALPALGWQHVFSFRGAGDGSVAKLIATCDAEYCIARARSLIEEREGATTDPKVRG